MKTHGRHALASECMVLHFTGVSYDAAWIEDKRRRCRERLAALRPHGAA